MKRLVLKVVGGLAALALVAVIAGMLWIDSLARAAIERGGTHALGVDVSVQRADIQPFGGRFDLHGFMVANPQGFGPAGFLELADGGVGLTLAKLRSDPIELDTLRLQGLDLRLQHDIQRSNFEAIVENLKRFESGQAPRDEPGRRFVIREIDLSDITVHVGLAQVERDVQFSIERIRLHDVGNGAEPLRLADVVAVIMEAVLDAAARAGSGVLPADMLAELHGALGQLEGLEAVRRAVEGGSQRLQERAGETVEGLKGELDKAAGKLQDTLESEKDKLEQGLRKLLPPKKDDDE